tara:strand:- start:340 stop:453 length:114 start_codon:yes stop_codon:yes gene_type:complete
MGAFLAFQTLIAASVLLEVWLRLLEHFAVMFTGVTSG